MRKPFILYKRKAGKKKADCYYIGFLDRKSGAYRRRVSATVLRDALGERASFLSPSSRAGAGEIARLALETHIGTDQKAKIQTGPYLKEFWNPDGAYASRKARATKPLSRDYLIIMRSVINVHVVPWLESTGRFNSAVQEITTGDIDDLLDDMFDSGKSAKRCNEARKALSKPFEELRRKKIIAYNPVKDTEKLREETTTRKILTIAEAAKFLKEETQDIRARTACLLAMTAGLRISEIVALQIQDLHREEVVVDGETIEYWWIELVNAWTESERLHSPKGESRGDVPIPFAVATELVSLHEQNPWRNSWIFWGESDHRPINARRIRAEYQRILDEIGIDAEEQESRGLDFHAWRHFYASHVKDTATKVLRHAESETTNRYQHLTEKERRDIADKASILLEGATA